MMKCKVQVMNEVVIQVDEKYRVIADTSPNYPGNALFDEFIAVISGTTGLKAFDGEALDNGEPIIVGIYDEEDNAMAEW